MRRVDAEFIANEKGRCFDADQVEEEAVEQLSYQPDPEERIILSESGDLMTILGTLENDFSQNSREDQVSLSALKAGIQVTRSLVSERFYRSPKTGTFFFDYGDDCPQFVESLGVSVDEFDPVSLNGQKAVHVEALEQEMEFDDRFKQSKVKAQKNRNGRRKREKRRHR